MGDFKILILAYLIGHSPIDTQQTFQMKGWFKTMEECKEHLLEQKPDGEFKWDWLVAGCKSDTTGEEFKVWPDYPKGKPKELEGIDFELEHFDI